MARRTRTVWLLAASLVGTGCSLLVATGDLAVGTGDGPTDATSDEGDGAVGVLSDGPVGASGDGADADVLNGRCPGRGGPTAIRIDSGSISYCIDSTEVTRAQYDEFLQTIPTVTSLPPFCGWKSTFLPSAGWPYTRTDKDLPVLGVDWCDAYAFCAWAGKRLCGGIGSATIDEITNPLKDEWLHACSAGGTRTFPHGNVDDPNACNTSNAAAKGAVLPVGALATCQGGFPGLFDMTGNVMEWLGICDSAVPDGGEGSTKCGLASTAASYPQTPCAFMDRMPRGARRSDWGFRCCSP